MHKSKTVGCIRILWILNNCSAIGHLTLLAWDGVRGRTLMCLQFMHSRVWNMIMPHPDYKHVRKCLNHCINRSCSLASINKADSSKKNTGYHTCTIELENECRRDSQIGIMNEPQDNQKKHKSVTMSYHPALKAGWDKSTCTRCDWMMNDEWAALKNTCRMDDRINEKAR